jgi:hypothetical protein
MQVARGAGAGSPGPGTYFLSAHAHGCEVDGGAVILDLRSGGYIGIDAGRLPMLRNMIANWPDTDASAGATTRAASAESDQLIAALLARGILATSPGPKRSTAPAVAKQALIPEPGGTIGLEWARRAPDFAASILRHSLRHRDRRLVPFLAWLNRRQGLIHRDRRHPSLDEIKRLLATYFSLRIWFYTAHRQCLFDSLVLATFLTRRRVPCTFMLGVSTKPFAAHAWVQSADLVLNDTAEHVQMFTPILAVGE